MAFSIDPKVFRAWVGKQPNADAVVRTIVRLQCTDTGADLFTQELSARLIARYTAGATGTELCRIAAAGLVGQIRRGGWVAAPQPSLAAIENNWYGSLLPWHDGAYQKQGMQAAAAIIFQVAGYPKIAAKIAAFIWAQQTNDIDLTIPGLFPAGALDAKWDGQWSYCRPSWIPFEDATQVMILCTMRAFGYDIFPSLKSIALILERNGFMVPYNASARSGVRDWARAVAPAALAVEESARVAMLFEDLEMAPELVLSTRGQITRLEKRDANGNLTGWWPLFVDGLGVQVYPIADPRDPTRKSAPRLGALTADKNLAVAGYDQDTQAPAQLVYAA